MDKYNKIIVAGTFDRLHSGHRKILSFAYASCNLILDIYICSNDLIKNKKYAEMIESYEARTENVIKYMSTFTENKNVQINYFELYEPYQSSIYDPTIDAIVVSSETIEGAKQINVLRTEKGIHPIEILVVERNDDVSSTKLREEEYKNKNSN